jgi:hypothetical protein
MLKPSFVGNGYAKIFKILAAKKDDDVSIMKFNDNCIYGYREAGGCRALVMVSSRRRSVMFYALFRITPSLLFQSHSRGSCLALVLAKF